MRWTQVASGAIEIGESMGYKLLAGGLIKQALEDVGNGCLSALLFLLLDTLAESLCEDVPEPAIFGYHEVRREAVRRWQAARLTASDLRRDDYWRSPCMVVRTSPCLAGSAGGCPLRLSRVSGRVGRRKPRVSLPAGNSGLLRVLIYGSEDWADEVAMGAVLGRLPLDSVIVHADRRGAERLAGEVAGKLGLATETWTPGRGRLPKVDVGFGFVVRDKPDKRSRALRERLERAGMVGWMFKGGGQT